MDPKEPDEVKGEIGEEVKMEDPPSSTTPPSAPPPPAQNIDHSGAPGTPPPPSLTGLASPKTPESTKTRESIESICSSPALDSFFAKDTALKVSYDVPSSSSVHFVSEKTTGMPIPDIEPTAVGVMAGLGIKRKETEEHQSGRGPAKKPKTLSEKREQLEADMLKYGLVALEQKYPRQQQIVPPKPIAGSPRRASTGSIIRMKPKPLGIDFEEIDVRKILKPLSHQKYIHEPTHDSVVYITRRQGIVPLSSLCKESNSVLSSDVKLLAGRNVRLGKPGIFVKDDAQRLYAVGGTRGMRDNFSVVKVPSLAVPKPEKRVHGAKLAPAFEMDDEYARFAVEALIDPDAVVVGGGGKKKGRGRVDIRKLKKMKKLEESKAKEEAEASKKAKGIITHVYDKIKLAEEKEKELEEKLEKEEIDKKESNKEEEVAMEVDDKAEEEAADDKDDDEADLSEAYTTEEDTEDEMEEDETDGKSDKPEAEKKEEMEVYNGWDRDLPVPGENPAEIETRAVTTEKFRRKIEEWKKAPIAGVDVCDIDECFCKEADEDEMTTSTYPTASQTPTSGSQTPVEGKPQKEGKVKTKLTKVKRALKSLGVNFYEFDDSVAGKEGGHTEVFKAPLCEKEFCRLGCICECISGIAVPPAHCGKQECMFYCSCSSEDTVKYASSKKVGISPAGAANLRSTSQRNLAAEERKFHNTVVATSSGKDLFMLGSTGRTKRERKIPSRYQDANPIGGEMNSKENGNGTSKKMDVDDYTTFDPVVTKLTDECMRDEKSQRCCVLVPRVKLPGYTLAWCMYHCQYSCPCSKFIDPLDFAPDCNVSEISKTKKKPSQGPKGPPGPPPPSLPIRKPSVEAIEIDSEEEGPYNHPKSKHSARTFGYTFERSNKVKLPYKVISQKTKAKPMPKSRRASIDAKEGDKAMSFYMERKPKGTIQPVKLSQLKEEFEKRRANVYCLLRPNRKPLVFLAKPSESPYAIDAVELRDLGEDQRQLLPTFILPLLSPDLLKDVVVDLVHNGIAWEVHEPPLRQQPKEKEAVKEEDDRAVPSEGEQRVLKLARGQNLVSVERKGYPAIQVKLPPTTKSQHWCVVRLENAEGSIQCPDSTLALKSDVLKQAANLSMQEKTTVRIPIPVPGEVTAFGVYAVPGLQSHVFVGPFTSKVATTTTELICLDSPPAKLLDCEEEEDDDVTVLPAPKPSSSSGRRKQTFVTKIDQEEKSSLCKNLVARISDKAVRMGENIKRNDAQRSRVVGGQVPQVVARPSTSTEEIVILIEDDDDEVEEVEQMKDVIAEENVKSKVAKNLTYLNVPNSEYGRVVLGSNPNADFAKEYFTIKVDGLDDLMVRMKPNGSVVFGHPSLFGHDVYCNSEKNARYWWLEHHGRLKEYLEKEKADDVEISKNLAKRMPVATSKLDRSRTSTFLNPNGTQGRAFLLENQRTKRERVALYAELYKVTFGCKPGKSQIQVLCEAKKLAESLTRQEKEAETTKKKLMTRRKQLFERFTVLLKDMPSEVKKKRLMELKNLMKKKEGGSTSETSAPRPQQAATTNSASQQQQQQRMTNGNSHQVNAMKRPLNPPQPRMEYSASVPPKPIVVPRIPQQQPPRPATSPLDLPLVMPKTEEIDIPSSGPEMPANIQLPRVPVSATHPHMAMSIAQSVPVSPQASPSFSSAPNGITPYSDVTGLKTVKKDGKVLRPMNAFMLWAKDHRKTLIANGYDGATVSKMLADQWKELTDEEKQKYYQDAEHLKNLHQLQHPDYKYSPRARTKKKPPVPNYQNPVPISPSPHPVSIAPAPTPAHRNIHAHMTPNALLAAHQQPFLLSNTPRAAANCLPMPIRIPTVPNSFPAQGRIATLQPGQPLNMANLVGVTMGNTLPMGRTIDQIAGGVGHHHHHANGASQLYFDGEGLRIQQQPNVRFIQTPGGAQGQGQGEEKKIVEISID